MYENGVDGDSLREVLTKACKQLDIGTAVLPQPLLSNDAVVDDLVSTEITSDDEGLVSREGVAPHEIVYTRSNQYSRTLNNEFNAVVVEHHLKWAPLCVSHQSLPGNLRLHL